jgi:intracellular sulfur oxidation DsrE/DsrF family protein
VVYQIDDADAQAAKALRNIRNQLEVSPDTEVKVVAYGKGVDFLLLGAKDPSGTPYAGLIAELHTHGISFEVCQVTMRARGLAKDQFVAEAEFTPSGVVRITHLQQGGFAYLKP